MEPSPNPRKLTRERAAQYLTALGFKITANTLTTMVTRGDGPPFVKFGNTPLYDADELEAWALNRCKRPTRSATTDDTPSASQNAAPSNAHD